MREKIYASLGKQIFLAILRLKVGSDAADTAEGFADWLEEIGEGYIASINKYNRLEQIEIRAAHMCQTVMDSFQLDDSRKEIIINNMSLALKKVQLNADVLFSLGGDCSTLVRELKEANPQYKDDLNQEEQELYERLTMYASHFVLNSFMILPEFTAAGLNTIDSKISELLEMIDSLLKEIDANVPKKKDIYLNFESDYCIALLNKVRYVNTYINHNTLSKYNGYKLDASYVQLAFDIDEEYAEQDVQVDVTKLLLQNKNVWISGEAGSGKTTFLQWLVLKFAQKKMDQKLIPVLISLRSVKEYSLRKCIESVMNNSSSSIPEGWIENTIQTGRFLFMFDGFDEVTTSHRRRIFDWIQEFDPDNKCHKIYTARPQVKEKEKDLIRRLRSIQFIHVCPMGSIQVKRFIIKWHKAVLIDQLNLSDAKTDSTALALHRRILLSDSLQQLASSPLLCTMICMLNHVNKGIIPNGRMQLYEECVNMLLERRDLEREINVNDVSLSLDKKRIILSKLAYWMMRNNHFAEAEFKKAVSYIGICCQDLGLLDEPEKILQYLVERSGLIRIPEPGAIEFIHRSFLEYLCALEIARDQDWGYVETLIGDDNWREVIINAIYLANKKDASRLIMKTLEFHNDRNINKYTFLAFSLLNNANEIEPSIRNSVEQYMEKIIPPQRGQEHLIAYEVQKLAIPFLSNQNYSPEERMSCIRTLIYIGGVQCLNAIVSFMDDKLSYNEIFVMCRLFQECDKGSLVTYNIPEKLLNFYLNTNNSFIVNNIIVTLLMQLPDASKRCFCDKAISIEYRQEDGESEDFDLLDDEILESVIMNSNSWYCSDFSSLFTNVETLIINGGNTQDLELINCFSSIKKLTIVNNSMSIYDLNKIIKTEATHIRDITLILSTSECVYFNDIHYLSTCCNVEIIFANNYEELYLDTLSELNFNGNLKIGCCDAMGADEIISSALELVEEPRKNALLKNVVFLVDIDVSSFNYTDLDWLNMGINVMDLSGEIQRLEDDGIIIL